MKKIILAISLVTAVTGVALAQTAETRGRTSAGNKTSASKQGQQLNLRSGTQMSGQLENTLDARHAKAGDRVVLKTTQAIKQDGQVVVPKGSRLIGHVTDVQQRTKEDNQSVMGIAFDRLQNGSMNVPIAATIVSITQARSQAQATAGDDLLGSQTMTSSSSQSSARSTSSAGGGQRGGGGLLGGAGSKVGGVLNTTTSTAGNVAGRATTAVGSTVSATTNATSSTTGNLTGSLRGLQITQSSDASAQGGSTLSLNGGNLHLESGTTFNLSVSSASSAGNP